jgi:transcriptional regulator GlxA family with amidase domain
MPVDSLNPSSLHLTYLKAPSSICTGALFPANLGVFDGRYCTTHWAAYATLNQYNKRAAVKTNSAAGTVLPARFIDSGLNDSQVRIISSGGISCGIDASLHVVTLRSSEDEALATAKLLDYAWRKTEGVIFGETFDV